MEEVEESRPAQLDEDLPQVVNDLDQISADLKDLSSCNELTEDETYGPGVSLDEEAPGLTEELIDQGPVDPWEQIHEKLVSDPEDLDPKVDEDMKGRWEDLLEPEGDVGREVDQPEVEISPPKSVNKPSGGAHSAPYPTGEDLTGIEVRMPDPAGYKRWLDPGYKQWPGY